MKTCCYNKKIQTAKNKMTKFDLSLNGPTYRLCRDTEPSRVNPALEESGKENHATLSSLLHFLFNLLGNRNGFPFRDEDKRRFHILRGEKVEINLKIVIGEMSFLCLLACVVFNPTQYHIEHAFGITKMENSTSHFLKADDRASEGSYVDCTAQATEQLVLKMELLNNFLYSPLKGEHSTWLEF